MKKSEFEALCGRYLIDVDLALENAAIREALQERDDQAIEYLLKNEF